MLFRSKFIGFRKSLPRTFAAGYRIKRQFDLAAAPSPAHNQKVSAEHKKPRPLNLALEIIKIQPQIQWGYDNMKNGFKWMLVSPFFFLLIWLPTKARSKEVYNPSLPKVVIVTTGGTVAMKYDPASGGVVPALSGKDLIVAVPGLDKIANIETVEFCNIDSSQMTPEIWSNLSSKVQKTLFSAVIW